MKNNNDIYIYIYIYTHVEIALYPFDHINPLTNIAIAPPASKETAMQTPSNHLEAMFCKAPAASSKKDRLRGLLNLWNNIQ